MTTSNTRRIFSHTRTFRRNTLNNLTLISRILSKLYGKQVKNRRNSNLRGQNNLLNTFITINNFFNTAIRINISRNRQLFSTNSFNFHKSIFNTQDIQQFQRQDNRTGSQTSYSTAASAGALGIRRGSFSYFLKGGCKCMGSYEVVPTLHE